MRLLIDSDVLLDFIGERESTAAAWVKLHAMELAGAAELWVSAEAFGEVRAALAEALSDHDARSALRSAMAFLSVCSIDGPDVRFADFQGHSGRYHGVHGRSFLLLLAQYNGTLNKLQ